MLVNIDVHLKSVYHKESFEWWTGSEWSTDTTEYIRLCERDSKTHTIKQLSEF